MHALVGLTLLVLLHLRLRLDLRLRLGLVLGVHLHLRLRLLEFYCCRQHQGAESCEQLCRFEIKLLILK